MVREWGTDVDGPAHETWTTGTYHWRGGLVFYAQCRCGWRGRAWKVRAAAEAEGEQHTNKTTDQDRRVG